VTQRSMFKEQTGSLLMSKLVPCWCRFLMPFFLVICIGLFACGHLWLALAIDIRIILIGLELNLKDFFEMSMMRAVKEMIQAKVWEMAILIIAVSVIWPYVRMLTMLFCWCAPTSVLHPYRRESILSWLDFLGKWSMFDIYTILLFVACLSLKITSPGQFAALPVGLYEVKLLLNPRVGLYCNLLAQFVSQIVAHIQMYWHRRVMEEVQQEEAVAHWSEQSKTAGMHSKDTAGTVGGSSGSPRTISTLGTLPRESVCSYACAMLGAQRASGLMRLLIPCALAFSVLLLLVGMVLPIFSVNTFGVVAKLMEFEDSDSRSVTYSFLELSQELVSIVAKDWTNQLGMWSLSAMFIISTAVLPIIQALLWCILWAIPLGLTGMKRVLLCIEVSAAWQFFDVFLIAVLITVLQIERFATGFLAALDGLLAKSQFEMINNVFSLMQQIGFLRDDDGMIFQLKSDLLIGAYVLLAAASLLMLIGIFVNRRAAAFLKLRQEKAWKLKAVLDDTPHPSKADARALEDALSSACADDDSESCASSTSGWQGRLSRISKTLSQIIPTFSNARDDTSEGDESPQQAAVEP